MVILVTPKSISLTGCEDVSPILDRISNESLLAIADLDNVLTRKGNVQKLVNDTVTDGKNHSGNDDFIFKSVNDINSVKVNEYGLSKTCNNLNKTKKKAGKLSYFYFCIISC